MNDSNPTLRKADKLLKRIVKKMGQPGLHYSVQIGIDSERGNEGEPVLVYAAMIAPAHEGLKPVTFISFSKVEFIEKIKDFLDNKISQTDLEIAFLEAKIALNNRANAQYQTELESILNPEPQEGEVVTEDGSEDSQPDETTPDEK